MAEQSYPFDAGSGATVDEAVWRRMARAWSPDGLIGSSGANEGSVELTGGPELVRKPMPTGAIVDGFYYRDPADLVVPIPPNVASNPRRDSLILRLDPAANSVVCVPKLGVPGPAPLAPALTQTPTGVYEIGLADYVMPPSGEPQNPFAVADTRRYAGSRIGCRLTAAAAQPVDDGVVRALTGWAVDRQTGVFFNGPIGNAIKIRPGFAGLYVVGYRVKVSITPTRRSLVEFVLNDTREYRTPAYAEAIIGGSHVVDLDVGDELKVQAYFSGIPNSAVLQGGQCEFYCWKLND